MGFFDTFEPGRMYVMSGGPGPKREEPAQAQPTQNETVTNTTNTIINTTTYNPPKSPSDIGASGVLIFTPIKQLPY